MKWISILLLLFVFEIQAKKSCDVRMTISNIVYNWSESDQSVIASGSISKKSKSKNCEDFEIGFSTGNSDQYLRTLQNNNESLSYNLYKDNNSSTALRSLQDAQNNEQLLKVHLGKNRESTNFTFIAKLPFPNDGKSFFKKGLYTDTIEAQIKNKKNKEDDAKINFNIKVQVPPQIDISMVDSGGIFDTSDTFQALNFGLLSKGKILGFDIIVRSNTGYSLFLSSNNNGKLKHVSHNSRVNYKLKVDGTKRNLRSSSGSPVEVGNYFGLTPATGISHNVEVKIGKTKNKLHGVYTDYIVVTTMSNE
jgi:spore coat protein U-like protein